jgi:hypothetical protein
MGVAKLTSSMRVFAFTSSFSLLRQGSKHKHTTLRPSHFDESLVVVKARLMAIWLCRIRFEGNHTLGLPSRSSRFWEDASASHLDMSLAGECWSFLAKAEGSPSWHQIGGA